MKILFILAPALDYFPFPPWAVGCLLTTLRELNCEVDVVDLHALARFFDYSQDEKAEIMLAIDPNNIYAAITGTEPLENNLFIKKVGTHFPKTNYDLVAISCALGQIECYYFASLLGKWCKNLYRTKVVIGGESIQHGLLQRLFTILFEYNSLDWICIGPGENVLKGIIRKLELGRGSLRNIPGLKYNPNMPLNLSFGQLEPECLYPDFSDIDFQAYELNSDVDIKNASYSLSDAVRILPFRFIRGCPFKCAFCKESNNNEWRFSKYKKVVRALKVLSENYSISNFHFLNSTMNFSKTYFKSICLELINYNLGIRWSDCVRADNFDSECAQLAANAGAVRLIFGLETASPKLLQRIGKRISLRDVERGLYSSKHAGIWTSLEIIVGFPGETYDDLYQTIEFLKKNEAVIDEIWINKFFLDPRSRIFAKPADFGITGIFDQRQEVLKNPFKVSSPPIKFHTSGMTFDQQQLQTSEFYDIVLSEINSAIGDSKYYNRLYTLFHNNRG